VTIGEILTSIQTIPDCEVLPWQGLPNIQFPYVLPDDVKTFYQLCGGVVLYRDAPFTATIVQPERVVPANPVIVGEACQDDISASWHVIGDTDGEYLTIDLHEERLGRCYDSFFDRHGVPGSCPIIATSFSELLQCLIENHGQHWYWLRSGFKSLGDAYDK
jgi:hypothetical protein